MDPCWSSTVLQGEVRRGCVVVLPIGELEGCVVAGHHRSLSPPFVVSVIYNRAEDVESTWLHSQLLHACLEPVNAADWLQLRGVSARWRPGLTSVDAATVCGASEPGAVFSAGSGPVGDAAVSRRIAPLRRTHAGPHGRRLRLCSAPGPGFPAPPAGCAPAARAWTAARSFSFRPGAKTEAILLFTCAEQNSELQAIDFIDIV